MSGTLSIVATPIGNLQDISLRATRTLLTADVIACEDTRKTGLLLQEITKQLSVLPDVKKPRLISFYDQVEADKTPEILELLHAGMHVALVSDAGTPTISDPGFKLVRAAAEAGCKIESIPGPSAVITALTVAGLPTDKFLFVGYPPKKDGHRKEFYHSLQTMGQTMRFTVVMYEAPHRIRQTLEELAEIFGERQHIVIARELTKIYEEVLRNSLEKLEEHFAKHEPKGEFVLLFHLGE